MRLFVSEFLCSGAVDPAVAPASLLREGRSMLLALVADLARLDGIRVCTCWHTGLGDWPLPGVDVVRVDSARDEGRTFRELAATCDATYVIAPELDGLLLQRCRLVEAAGGSTLNCTLEAIALTGDKLRLWQHLEAAGIPSIPTSSLTGPVASDGPCVIKPRCGAGSEDIRVINDATTCQRISAEVAGHDMIVQPYIAGTPCSVAAFFDASGRLITLLPPTVQHLSNDGRLKYQGGECPFETQQTDALYDLVRTAAATIDGLRGYVGFDILLPHDASEPLLVEINPRLTTSYLGYRALSRDNPAAWLLPHTHTTDAPRWRSTRIIFQPNGTVVDAPAGTVVTAGTGA